TDGHLLLTVDTRLVGVQGTATPPRPQTHTLILDRTLFVDGFHCTTQCDADAYNFAMVRSTVLVDRLRATVRVRDITVGAREMPVMPSAQRQTPRRGSETVRAFTLEDLGFDPQPPAKIYSVTIDAGLQAVDGQVLGY